MISIIKQFTKSKTGIESANEDGLFISEKYIAVIDGATSKVNKLHNGLTGGQVVRNIIISYLQESSGLKPFKETVLDIQHCIENSFPASRYFPASASAVIYNIQRNELWMVGDCQALVNHQLFCNKKKVDTILSEARALAINALLSQGISETELMIEDKARELILPFLQLQRNFENTAGPFGFLVFNNHSMEEELLDEQGIVIPIPNYATVVLASDGYPYLTDSFEETEKKLAKILTDDPLCYKENKSTKGIRKDAESFDDRSYLKFVLARINA